MPARRRRRGRRGTKDTTFSRLPDDTIADILLRLPAESVLCAGAVCKAWRSFTTDPSFLAAHARLQQAQVVMYSYLDEGPYELALDVVPFSGDDDEAARRRLIRYPRTTRTRFLLLASCNGVLLFRMSHGSFLSFLLCNPVTRQWAELPRVGRFGEAEYQYAFYSHQPSGEYRLLLRRGLSWLILSTGAAEPRRVDMPPGTSITNSLVTAPPVALGGRLHWPPRVVAGAGMTTTTTEMMVFDTVSETFHRMAGPPTATADMVKLFEMEGRLAAADFGEEEHVDLWFLDDYDAGRWERRHRVATAWEPDGVSRGPPQEAGDLVCVAAAGDGEGNVMLGSHLWLAVYNLRTKTARTVDSVVEAENDVLVSRHVFSASLVRHPSFAARSTADLGLTFSWS
nr:F-box protein At3g07870-like [Setaria viridis]